MMKKIPAVMMLFVLFGCATSANFSLLSPGANDFHPKTVGILPATVGEYEPARDVVEAVVSKSLVSRTWFENVVDASTIKTQVASNPEVANDLSAYIQKVNTLGVSDPKLAVRLRESLKAEAFFMTYVTAWGYGRVEGNKVGRVGLGVKLIDSATGIIIWKANHEIVEDYWFFKPKLNEMAGKVMNVLLKEMPHAAMPSSKQQKEQPVPPSTKEQSVPPANNAPPTPPSSTEQKEQPVPPSNEEPQKPPLSPEGGTK